MHHILKTVTMSPSKTLLSTYQTVRCHILEYHCDPIISMCIASYLKCLTSTTNFRMTTQETDRFVLQVQQQWSARQAMG